MGQQIDLKDVITPEIQQNIQDAFAYATNFGVVFIDRDGQHIGEGSNFSKLCQAINQSEEGREACAQSNRKAVQIALSTGMASIYVCHAGMINIEIPLLIDGKLIGAVTAGQVFAEKMDDFPQDCHVHSSGWLKEEPFKSYYQEIPTFSTKRIYATAEALMSIANHIVSNYHKQQMQEEIVAQTLRLHDMEKMLAEARFDALSKQIKPHFLFNVLNSISRLIDIDETATANRMLRAFARMFRYQLHDPRQMISLKEELAYIEDYLQIQRIRFGDILQVVVEHDRRADKILLPFFALQPLVENAIEHGILPKGEKGKLLIRTRMGEHCLYIDICDDGVGIEAKVLEQVKARFRGEEEEGKRSLGILNSAKRLRDSYGAGFHFDLRSQPHEGTLIRISLCQAGEPDAMAPSAHALRLAYPASWPDVASAHRPRKFEI